MYEEAQAFALAPVSADVCQALPRELVLGVPALLLVAAQVGTSSNA